MTDITLPTEAGSVDMSFQTASDLSALQYTFVKLDASELAVTAGANGKVGGILQNAPNGSSTVATATIRVLGISKLKINETVAFGNYLTSTSGGLGELADAANEEIGAMALSSGEQNDLIAVAIVHCKDTDGNA